MASDKAQLKAAHNKYEGLQTNKVFSFAPDVGYTAILVSSYLDSESQEGLFLEEGYFLCDQLEGEADLIICRSREVVLDVIQDPEVASIITVGNGSFSDFWVPGTETDVDRIDWRTVSSHSTHLKTGSFVHRTCGHFSRNLNLPVGFFLMSDRTNLVGAYGQEVDDWQPDESSFIKIFDDTDFTLPELYKMGTLDFKKTD